MLKVYKKIGKIGESAQTGDIDLFCKLDKIRMCQVLIFTCKDTKKGKSQ